MGNKKNTPRSGRGARPSAASGLSGIVVVCFGPRSSYRGLIKSYTKMASDLGVRCLEVDAFDSTTLLATGLGERLRTALRSLDPGPVLLVHDDVAIDRGSVDRLVEAHLGGAGAAVPMTNDRNTAHFHGPLPRASTARSELKQLANAADSGHVVLDAARVGCVVADRAMLDSLIDDRLHDPFVALRDRGVGLVAVQNAFAAHDGTCGEQIRASAAGSDRPLLVAAMIVRDEEAMLPDCLASLNGIVDRVELVDTGSSDATIDIARTHGCSITEIAWQDDFAAARNVAADRCRDAHFTLWIDADERVRTPDAALLRDLLGAYRDDFEALDVQLMNRNDGLDAEPSSVFRARRVVRADLLEFEGRIHETPVRRGARHEALTTTTFDLLSIDHLGYAQEVVHDRNKHERNVQLARAAHRETGSVKSAVDLARSLMLGDETASEEAIVLLRHAIESAEGPERRPDWMAYLCGSLAHLLLDAGETADAIELARQGFDLLPTDDLVCAVLARGCLSADCHDELLRLAAAPVPTGLPDPVYDSPDNRRIYDDAVLVATARVGDASAAWHAVEPWPATGQLDVGRLDTYIQVASHRFDGVDLLEQLLVAAVTAGVRDELVPCAARVLTPDLTSLLALAVTESGAPSEGTVSTGLVAAMVSETWNVFDELVEHVGVLDAEIRRRISAQLAQRGHDARAAKVHVVVGSDSLVSRMGAGSDRR